MSIQLEIAPALIGAALYFLYWLLVQAVPRSSQRGQHRAHEQAPFEQKSDCLLAFDLANDNDSEPLPEPAPEPSSDVVARPPHAYESKTCVKSRIAPVVLLVVLLLANQALKDHSRQTINSDDCLELKSKESRMAAEHEKSTMAAKNEKTTATAGQPLVVKLERQIVDEGGNDEFMKSAYIGTLLVGTPAMEMAVVFDTGSGVVVLPSMYCKSETCKMHNRYKRSASLTGRDINFDGKDTVPRQPRDSLTITYGSGVISGVVVEDVICVGGATQSPNASEGLPPGCMAMRFLAATALSDDPFSSFEFDGIVGLGLEGLSESSEFNFLSVITQSLGAGSPKTFGVFLADHPREESELAMGGYTEARLREDLSWAPVHNPELGHWIVPIRSLRVDGVVLNFCEDGACKAAVDTGSSLLATPSAVFKDLFKLLRRLAPSAGHCQGMGPLLHIVFDDFTLTLGPRQYATVRQVAQQQYQPRPHFTAKKNTLRKDLRCFPNLMTIDLEEPLGPKLFILGEPVLRKYYTVYDAQRKTVGFGRAMHDTAPSREDLLTRSVDLDGPRKGSRIPTMFEVFRWRSALRQPLAAAP